MVRFRVWSNWCIAVNFFWIEFYIDCRSPPSALENPLRRVWPRLDSSRGLPSPHPVPYLPAEKRPGVVTVDLSYRFLPGLTRYLPNSTYHNSYGPIFTPPDIPKTTSLSPSFSSFPLPRLPYPSWPIRSVPSDCPSPPPGKVSW